MKSARSMINLREHALLTRPKVPQRDDTRLELNRHVYRQIRPSVALPQRRVVQAEIKEMKLPSDTTGFGYDFYDTARGVGEVNTRSVQFGQQDACDLRTEVHALKTVLLKPGESFVRFIHEGGSGAKPYVVRLPNGHEVLRKLMLKGSYKKQDEEAQGEEVIRGFGQGGVSLHGAEDNNAIAHKDPRIAAVLNDPEKVALLQKFIRNTRPDYFGRYVATVLEPDKERVFASFFDQEFVKGCEFAQAISNNNRPLSEAQVDVLAQAQLDILDTFYDYQAKIFQALVNDDTAREQASDYYLSRLNSRVLDPLAQGEFDELWLNLPLSDGQASAPHQRFNLGELFRSERVQVNGQVYKNPLSELPRLIAESPSPLLGWSMHGDPQQTNFLLKTPMVVSPSESDDRVEKARLLCIDNRPAQITPYTADLEKAVWGAGWVPVFQGDVKPSLSADSGDALGASFNMTAREGAQNGVKNFAKFENKLQQGLKQAPWYQKLEASDSTLQKRVVLASVTQCLCDIGIAVKRLEQARQAIVAAEPDLDLPGTQHLIQMLTERIVGDFLLACQNYSKV